jgi:O-antigen ligase
MDFGRLRPGTAMRLAAWVVTFGIVFIVLQSALWHPSVPLPLKAAVAGLAILAAVQPTLALVALAALVPFGHLLVTHVWHVTTFMLSEGFVIAFLAGYLWHERFRPSEPPDHVTVAARLFACIIVASCLVQYVIVQFWNDSPLPYALSFARFLLRGYLTEPQDVRFYANGRAFVSTAGALVEGIALVIATRRLTARDPAITGRVVNVAVAAAAVGAVMTVVEAFRVAATGNGDLIEIVRLGRWSSPMIPSLNTSGAYFLMIAFLALSIAARSRRWMVPAIAAAALCLAAVRLTGTQSAVVAGLGAVAALTFWFAANRFRWSPRVMLTGAVATGLAVAAFAILYNPFQLRVAEAARSIRFRLLFAETAWRMIESRPMTGVGIGQYIISYQQFASPELVSTWQRNDAHNYFLWIGAELGLLGLGAFLWMLAAALRDGWKRVRSHRRDPSDPWLLAGVAAFMMTWAAGQPMAVPQAAYTFWILLGCISAPSRVETSAAHAAIPSRALRYAAAAAIVLIVASVPARATRAIDVDLRVVEHGFHHSSQAGDQRFRWAGPRIRFYMESSAKSIVLRLAAKHPDTPEGATVDIRVDGKPARRVMLRDRAFHRVSLQAPVSSARFWRVDLEVEPISLWSLPEASHRIAFGDISVERGEDAAPR